MTSQAVRLTIFGQTDVGKVRKNNEDAFVVANLGGSPSVREMSAPLALEVGDRGVLLAVSDGMGGEQAGEVASALTLEFLRHEMKHGAADTVETALRSSVEKANDRVWNTAIQTGRTGMGATLTAVLFHDVRAYVAEIGDSRAYLLRGGRCLQLTHDQSYVQALVDAGTFTEEQAEQCEYKNVILQAVGTTPSVVVALNRLSLRRGDRFLLCSDGLTRMVRDDEMQNIVSTAPGLDAACAKLIALANERGGVDNVSAVLAAVDGEGLPAANRESRISVETLQPFPRMDAASLQRH
jgi:serine/threonine protein phosphatase PrpC